MFKGVGRYFSYFFQRGSSALYEIYIGFCPRLEFYKKITKIVSHILHVHECYICETIIHSSISFVKFQCF